MGRGLPWRQPPFASQPRKRPLWAFSLKQRFIHESGQYAEMETGSTTLAFASEAMAQGNGVAVRPNNPANLPAGFELCLVTDDPDAAFTKAVKAGAAPVRPVEQKPWGQRVAYVRDLDGCLLELCTPMSG